MAKNEIIYINVPCTLYKGFLEAAQRKDICNNILYYALTAHYDKSEITDTKERWRTVQKHFGLRGGMAEEVLDKGRKLIEQFPCEAFFSCNKDVIFDFRDSYKSEEECTLLLAYLALKSIIGNRLYAKTNKMMWFSRMDGNTKTKELSDKMQKWNSKHGYGARKLKALLWKYYGVSFYSKSTHGFYASLTLGDKELAKAVKNEHAKNITAEFKKAQQNAANSLAR